MNKKYFLIIILVIIIVIFTSVSVYASLKLSLDDIDITNSSGNAYNPDMVWNGSNFGLVWSDNRDDADNDTELEIRFVRLNSFGTKVSDEIEISDSEDIISDHPAIVWTGNLYGIVWVDGCNLLFTRVNEDGKKHGGITEVASDNFGTCPTNPNIVWNGLRYGISWHETRFGSETSKIFFTMIDYDGEKTSKDIWVSDVLDSQNASIVWTGLEYGFAWQADNSIYFNKLNRVGLRQGIDIKISNIIATSTNPDIIWNGSDYGVAWQGYDEDNQQQIYFIKLDKDGNKLENEIIISSNQNNENISDASLAWANSEFAITWKQGDSIINFIAIGSDGKKKSEIIQIFNESDQQIFSPVIAPGTYQYGFAWQDGRGAGNEIYFSRIGFEDVNSNNLSFLAFIGIFNNNLLIIIIIIIAGLFLFIIKDKKKTAKKIL